MASDLNVPSPDPDRNTLAAFLNERRKGPLIMLGTKRAASWELLMAVGCWQVGDCGGCGAGIYPGQLWAICEVCGTPHHDECIPPRKEIDWDQEGDIQVEAVVCRGCRS